MKVTRFQEHTNDYPWKWLPIHLDDYFADRRSDPTPATVSTLRTQAGAIRAFCNYLTEPLYGWAPFCETVFNDVPSQIVFEWNSPRHTADDDVPPGRRSLTLDELQKLFDAADDIVDEEYAARSKGWLPAMRDSLAFKVAYAYGLRRRELAMLEYVDFGPNPHIPKYGGFGALQVRWARERRALARADELF
jgi:integrase/recombinase XerD